MKVKVSGKTTITVEASSPKALEKILDQPWFELNLRSTDDDGDQQALSKTTKGERACTLATALTTVCLKSSGIHHSRKIHEYSSTSVNVCRL